MLTGIVGRVDWHYYTAAGINGYNVTPPPRKSSGKPWMLVANVVLQDAFKMSQRPLTFVAKHSKGEWRFPILSFEINPSNHRMTARLGPPERPASTTPKVQPGKVQLATK